MRVRRMENKTPLIVTTFADLLWAHTPKEWDFHDLYHKSILYISIIVSQDESGNKQILERTYSFKNIKGREDDIWGMAADCAAEMISSNA